jgi:high affinity sulfate transporter 1
VSVRSWGRAASSWLPGVEAARSYDRRQVRGDVTAGIVVAALLVPQGMAYAQLAGLPPETGLYATVACLMAYALVGPSPTLLLGPDSSLAALIAAAVLPLAGDDTASIVPLAAVLAILVGLISIVGGFLRLGTITELFSKPVRVGYLHGLAAVILAGQLPVLFGFSVESDGFVETVRSFAEGIVDDTNGYALGLGAATLCIIVGGRLVSAKLPGVLVAVMVTTAVSWAFDLEGEGVTAVGAIPVGLPTPGLADVALGDVRSLLPAAIAIALVALADTSTLSSAIARRPAGDGRRAEPVDPNREIIGLGVANVACGFMQGFPVSASTTRTMVAASVGSRSQLAGVTGAALVAVVLLAGGDLVAHLPVPVLAAVIIAAAVRMVDLATLKFLWRVRWSDLALSLTATAAVVAFGVFEGIAVAVGLSLAVFVGRSWRPYDAVLGRLEGVKGYHDLERHPGGRRVPGLVVFRFDAPLYFANAEHFRRRVEQVLDEEAQTVAWLLIAAEPITDIDTTAAEMLDHLLDDLRGRGVRLAFAELKGRPKDQLRRYGLYDRMGDDAFHPTLGRAIDAYVDATGVDWTDWSDT